MGLQVSVENFPPVTVGQASQDLEEENLKEEIFLISTYDRVDKVIIK